MNLTACEEECVAINGHIPYLYEADIVLSEILKNGTISTAMYPIFANYLSDGRKSISKEKSRKFTFFISTTYNFQTKLWKSGGFEIIEKRWAEVNSNEPTYPILNDRLHLVRNENRWASSDHFGAVYCGDELGEQWFKVCVWHSRA